MATDDALVQDASGGETSRKRAGREEHNGEKKSAKTVRKSSFSTSDGCDKAEPEEQFPDQEALSTAMVLHSLRSDVGLPRSLSNTPAANSPLLQPGGSSLGHTAAATSQHLPPTSVAIATTDGNLQSVNQQLDIQNNENRPAVSSRRALPAQNVLVSQRFGMLNPCAVEVGNHHQIQNRNAQLGRGMNEIDFASTEWENWPPHTRHFTMQEPYTPVRPQDFGFQALLNEATAVSSSFHPGVAGRPPQFRPSNMPIQPGIGPGVGGLATSPNRMRVPLQDDLRPFTNADVGTWMAAMQAQPGQNPRPIMNLVYDPAYEAMGSPVDPHLRMWLLAEMRRGTRNQDPKQ